MSGRGRPQLVIPASGANSLPRLPTFVEHGGEIACRHPADALQSRLYGFVLDADPDLLAAYCDRLFNRPTLGDEDWEPMGSELLLNFVDIPTMGSTDPLDRRLGVCHEREAAISFPVIDRRRDRFAWAIPYMFVDSALALAGGREVYGFPKQMGTLQIPVGKKTPSELSINTVTLEKYARDSETKGYRVITVKRSGEAKDLDLAPDDPARTLRELNTAADPGSVAGRPRGTHDPLVRASPVRGLSSSLQYLGRPAFLLSPGKKRCRCCCSSSSARSRGRSSGRACSSCRSRGATRGDGWVPWMAPFRESNEMPGMEPVSPPSLWEFLLKGLRLALTYNKAAKLAPEDMVPAPGVSLHPAGRLLSIPVCCLRRRRSRR